MIDDNSAHKTNRSVKIDSRVTPEEYARIRDIAAECGLSLSQYVRKVALGHKPNYRLSEEECEALNSLSAARGDIVHISNILKNRTDKERQSLFRNTDFMANWLSAATYLMEQTMNVIKRLMK